MPIERLWDDTADITTSGDRLEAEISAFNNVYGNDGLVTVKNTTDALLRDQLIAPSPEYGEPDWSTIKRHRRTLTALKRFAETHNVHLNIRFVMWNRAFEHLTHTVGATATGDNNGKLTSPDVAQIGSTWIAYFDNSGAILTHTGRPEDSLRQREINGRKIASIRYIVDVRFLCYWKRLPFWSHDAEPFVIDSTNWQTLINSVAKRTQHPALPSIPPVVLPIGFTHNLIHDYTPLVWSGNGDFLENGKSLLMKKSFYVDMSSDAALKIPWLIAKNAKRYQKKGIPTRSFAFPEMSHYEIFNHFLNGRFSAIIEPTSFLKSWRQQFMAMKKSEDTGKNEARKITGLFWDYAEIASLPTSYKGGSDLMVSAQTKYPDQAVALTRFITTDPEFQEILVSSGELPAQMPNYGIEEILLNLSDGETYPKQFVDVILQAIQTGREYPALPDFPTALENREVLASFQQLWRNIGAGVEDDDIAYNRIRQSAMETQQLINRQIHLPTKMRVAIESRRWILFSVAIIVIISLVALYIFTKRNCRRDRMLRVAIEIIRHREFVLTTSTIRMLGKAKNMQPYEIGLYSDLLTELRDRVMFLEENVRHDLQTKELQSQYVQDLIVEAWEIAKLKFSVTKLSLLENSLSITIDNRLQQLQLAELPHSLVGILQEWFYLRIKGSMERDGETSIDVQYWENGKVHGIIVISPGATVKDIVAPFLPAWRAEQANDLARLSGQAQAFILIADLCKVAYGARPDYAWISRDGRLHTPKDSWEDDFGSYLKITLPMTRNNRKLNGKKAKINYLDRRRREVVSA